MAFFGLAHSTSTRIFLQITCYLTLTGPPKTVLLENNELAHTALYPKPGVSFIFHHQEFTVAIVQLTIEPLTCHTVISSRCVLLFKLLMCHFIIIQYCRWSTFWYSVHAPFFSKLSCFFSYNSVPRVSHGRKHLCLIQFIWQGAATELQFFLVYKTSHKCRLPQDLLQNRCTYCCVANILNLF